MALTVSFDLINQPDNVVGNKRNRHVTVVPDSSYAIGGETLTPAMVGLVAIDRIIPVGLAVDPDTADLAVLAHYDRANQKLQFFWGEDGAALDEVPDQTDLSGFSVELVVVGW